MSDDEDAASTYPPYHRDPDLKASFEFGNTVNRVISFHRIDPVESVSEE